MSAPTRSKSRARPDRRAQSAHRRAGRHDPCLGASLRPRRCRSAARRAIGSTRSADEEVIRAMRELTAKGRGRGGGGGARSSRRRRAPRPVARRARPAAQARRLRRALEGFDEEEANAILDECLLVSRWPRSSLTSSQRRWPRSGAAGRTAKATVAQEHFASSVVRGRLLGLARGWGVGAGPLALLACLPGELHDLGLIAFGLSLRQRGWRIAYLGADAAGNARRRGDSLPTAGGRRVSASEPGRLAAVAEELRLAGPARPDTRFGGGRRRLADRGRVRARGHRLE